MTLRMPAVTLLALAAALVAASDFHDTPPTDWIRRNAIALTSPEAGHGFEDLKPLKKLIGDARIVSLGEATHGTREMFQLKHRMLEFLATEMDFTIFSIEANMPEAYRLNDYVLTGKGDPAELLRGLYFWTWNTEEVLDMIRWMREFNRSGKGRVQFTGFDMQTSSVAAGIVGDFAARYEPEYETVVRAAAAKAVAAKPPTPGPPFGLASGSLPGNRVAGRKVRYSGYIRTEGVKDGYAGLWWRVDGASGMLSLDNMNDRGATGTTDWKRYEIELTVDPGAKNVVFGAIMPGTGTAWFDDLSVDIEDQPYADGGSFDFTFESAAVRGFFTAGRGYQIGLDSSIAHGGKQSLRMKGGPSPVDTSATGPEKVAAEWSEIVTHLEGGRSRYRSAGASVADIEWTIQDGRIVRQAAESLSDPLSRDRSMAENVSWILNQNPGAKVVLWAHDGHVAAGGLNHETMGTHLRQNYGAAMVVFGFTFNQGSFQAIDQGTRKLRDFTVPPVAANVLDAALASAGLPLFALDLRKAPVWFKEPRRSRQFGAMFSDENAAAYAMDLRPAAAFDALFFIEKTTAARKNPPPPSAKAPGESKP